MGIGNLEFEKVRFGTPDLESEIRHPPDLRVPYLILCETRPSGIPHRRPRLIVETVDGTRHPGEFRETRRGEIGPAVQSRRAGGETGLDRRTYLTPPRLTERAGVTRPGGRFYLRRGRRKGLYA